MNFYSNDEGWDPDLPRILIPGWFLLDNCFEYELRRPVCFESKRAFFVIQLDERGWSSRDVTGSKQAERIEGRLLSQIAEHKRKMLLIPFPLFIIQYLVSLCISRCLTLRQTLYVYYWAILE